MTLLSSKSSGNPDDGGKTTQSAPVTKPHAPFLAKFHPRH